MSTRHVAPVLLLLAIVAAVGMRGAALSEKYTVEHDEAISYLAATCNQARWEAARGQRAYPFGAWTPASAWETFFEPRSAFCFKQIGQDLAHHDIHPPLYFWLLHLWVLVVGVHVWTGPTLNILISALGVLALFGLARRVLGSATEGALVALVWAVSPAVVTIALEARQYELFALVTVAFVWALIRWADSARPGWRESLPLAAAAAAGALTHYHFALVAAAAALFLAARLRADRRRLLGGVGAIAAGYAVSIVVHPRFYESFGREQAQAETFNLAGIPDRVERVLSALGNFLVPEQAASNAPLLFLLPALLAAAAAVVVLTARGRRSAGRPGGPSVPLYTLYFFGSIAGATVLLYLAFFSHRLAMEGKYLAAAWPFLAFLPVLGLRLVARWRIAAAVALGCLLGGSGVAAAVLYYRADGRPQDPAGLMPGARPVLLDSSRRGVVPRFVLELPDERRILAADQAFLLDGRDRRLAPEGGPMVYVSDELYGDDRRKGEILRRLRRRHRVTPVNDGDWGIHRLFRAWQVESPTAGRTPALPRS